MSDLVHAIAIVQEAAAQLRELRGRPVVVKLGGSAMEVPEITRETLRSIVTLADFGLEVVLVHGGGKPIDRAMEQAGLTPRKVAGRRYTDDATLSVVVKVLSELNHGVVRELQSLGAQAVGFTELPSFPLIGERLLLPGLDLQPIDLGHVGHVTAVKPTLFPETKAIRVLPSLAVDTSGGWLNVNADTVASAVARALGAEVVLFLTDTPGILRDVKDAGSLIPSLSRTECEHLIRTGVVSGGMLPKVEACFGALDSGAKRAVILDGRRPESLLTLLLKSPMPGTAITR